MTRDTNTIVFDDYIYAFFEKQEMDTIRDRPLLSKRVKLLHNHARISILALRHKNF